MSIIERLMLIKEGKKCPSINKDNLPSKLKKIYCYFCREMTLHNTNEEQCINCFLWRVVVESKFELKKTIHEKGLKDAQMMWEKEKPAVKQCIKEMIGKEEEIDPKEINKISSEKVTRQIEETLNKDQIPRSLPLWLIILPFLSIGLIVYFSLSIIKKEKKWRQ